MRGICTVLGLQKDARFIWQPTKGGSFPSPVGTRDLLEYVIWMGWAANILEP